MFGVVDDTTTTKFTSRACAVHCNSLPVVVDKAVVVVLKFPNNGTSKNATSFPGSLLPALRRSVGWVGENPGNEVAKNVDLAKSLVLFETSELAFEGSQVSFSGDFCVSPVPTFVVVVFCRRVHFLPFGLQEKNF